jgi:hypothetical protein
MHGDVVDIRPIARESVDLEVSLMAASDTSMPMTSFSELASSLRHRRHNQCRAPECRLSIPSAQRPFGNGLQHLGQHGQSLQFEGSVSEIVSHRRATSVGQLPRILRVVAGQRLLRRLADVTTGLKGAELVNPTLSDPVSPRAARCAA